MGVESQDSAKTIYHPCSDPSDRRVFSPTPSVQGECITIIRLGEKLSDSKDLECGSFRHGEPSSVENGVFSDMFGTSESKPLKVAALNLFYPTASPLPKNLHFSHYETAFGGREWGE